MKVHYVKMKLLSICTAAYNAEKTIGTLLDSLLICKNRELVEIIVVDDGSTDETGKIVSKYAKSFPDLVKYFYKENGGSGSARNLAFDKAIGKYLKIIDADDEVYSSEFDEFLVHLNKIDVDMVVNGHYRYNIKSKQLYAYDSYNKWMEPDKVYDIEKKVFDFPIACYMHEITYRSEIFKNHQIYLSEKMPHVDMEYLVLPIPYIRTIAYIDFKFYKYNLGIESQSMNPQNFISHESKLNIVINRLLEYKNNFNDINQNNYNMMVTRIAAACAVIYKIYCLKKDFKQKHYIIEYDKRIRNMDSDVWKRMQSVSKNVRLCRLFNYNGYYLMIIAHMFANRK